MSDVPELRYAPLAPVVKAFALARANDALGALRSGRIEGAAVLLP